ncbi:MAG: hypothetical protein J5913_02690 [Prevotella sp.]|nr:hypothetical protein [Prevotella sp.]MBO5591851.1 hypothetical protein [Prevotella sp.]MBP3219619.1 hypothetical protein [Prevotella sp.]
MDAFIHDKVNGLAKFIQMGLSNLWIVFEGSKAVAFFALSKEMISAAKLRQKSRPQYRQNTTTI